MRNRSVTDEKINQIVDKYGLPSELNENMFGWKNGNYLNDIYSIWYVIAVIAVGVLAVSLTKGILHYKVKQVV